MNAPELTGTAKTLVAGDKGLLAMDESNPDPPSSATAVPDRRRVT